MTKESIYKELRNYGEILDDREATTSFGFERMLRIKYEGKIYFIELLNGRVMRILEDWKILFFNLIYFNMIKK